MSDTATVIEAYFGMWNETDPAARSELIEQAWADEASYLDPVLEANGREALSEMVAGVHAQFPGHRFRRTTEVDVHHTRVRFGWELAAPDGTVAVAGVDVAELAADGRLRSIVGFFGDLAVAA